MNISENKKRGFTLIELLVVIAIIGMLSSVVLASLNTARAKARDARRLADMDQIIRALELFFHDHGHYPGSAEEGVPNSAVFVGVNDLGGVFETAMEPYLSPMPKDPRHDGVLYFYSYDPVHISDAVKGICYGEPGHVRGDNAAVVAFHTAESNPSNLRKDTCSGGNKGQDKAHFNVTLFPSNPK